ncbi:MAG: helix-turn-helix domain-containing protein [Candidatus Thermoplasmatota archaeon]|nr:helix-turn-helix domain-containing protein [Candidatus Thermoplasmatota archaeon]
MSFEDVDELFYLLENPTRRRILQLLSVERLYPLKMHKQLSKDMDVTQQAIVKHLKILEEHGIVQSRDEPSNRGPNRRVYHASKEISLHIDVGPSTYKQKAETDFDLNNLSEQHKHVLDAIEESRSMDSKARMDLLSRVSEDLRKSVDDVENERRSLMALMGELNREITSTAQMAECGYQERRLLHHILHNKDYTREGAAVALGLREAEVRLILESLQNRGLTR